MILKAIALVYLGIGGLCSLARAYHLLPSPEILPLFGYAIISIPLLTFSGIIIWHAKEPKDPVT